MAMNKKPVIAVIGGGAAGITAALHASYILNNSAEIIILERMDRIGKKILATGNGRCNFTNINASKENYYGENPSFVCPALNNFTVSDTIAFFKKLGIYPKEEQNGKIYPYSDRASSVLDVMRCELERLKIRIITKFEAKQIIPLKSIFKINSFSGETITAKKVILAAGGCASPNLGSNGTGFKLLKTLGHTITNLTPALVQLKTPPCDVKSLQGIKFTGSAALIADGKEISSEYGEILFTDYGLSGPPIFQLSAKAASRKDIIIRLDFMPYKSKSEVFDILTERKENLSHLTLESFFTGFLNKRIGIVIAKKSGVEKLSLPVSQLKKETIWTMASLIKSLDFNITGKNGWNNAQVTAGGANTSEFNPNTMESRFIKGLYAAGEVLDVFGDCGGYNLQWAWSSGAIAGKCVAESVMKY